MKKLLKLAAVFAAFALMFGFASCSDDDDDENNDESGPATVAVESVTIGGDITEVEVGKTITLTATVAPENATVKTVTWTSSDPAKATVKDGVVTGVTAGEVKITATSTADSTKKAEKTITVKAAATTDPDDPNPPATEKTAVLSYDGSEETNAPSVAGDSGIFAAPSTETLPTAGVYSTYTVDDGYPKWETGTFTGDDGVKNGTTGSGIRVVSKLIDGNTAVNVATDETVAWLEYKFTLENAAEVTADVKAFNTQSSNLKGKLEILASDNTLKTSKVAESGSKSANGVTADAVSLAAGTYTLKFSWISSKDATYKKVNCGVSAYTITAKTAN